jgi:hypothetical protein
MALRARQAVSVNTSATRLDADPTDNVSGSALCIIPQASGTLCLGPAGVTSANGARIAVTASVPISVDLNGNEQVYGVVASGTLEVDVLLVGV